MEVRRFERMKACPFCAEDILVAAIKCKHCGSTLGEHAEMRAIPPPPPPTPPRKGSIWTRDVRDINTTRLWWMLILVFGGLWLFGHNSTSSTTPVVPVAETNVGPVETEVPQPKVEALPRETPKPVPVELPPLTANITGNNMVFKVRNDDTFAWTECSGDINMRLFNFGYGTHFGTVQPGETVALEADEFANSDGERFNPLTHKVNTFFIDCMTPKGKQSSGGSF